MAGWALIGIGLWIHIFQESMLIGVLLKDNPTEPMIVIDRVPVMLIGCGAVITVIGFLGCCGACTESVCFLGFVSIFILLMFNCLNPCLFSLYKNHSSVLAIFWNMCSCAPHTCTYHNEL